jgi:hypothetical protein
LLAPVLGCGIQDLSNAHVLKHWSLRQLHEAS